MLLRTCSENISSFFSYNAISNGDIFIKGEFSPSYEGKRSPTTEDVKPTYLINYGNSSSSDEKPYDQYYNKTNPIKPDPMKVPKTEVTSQSCCNVPPQGELLVPKTEITSSCR